MHKKYVFGLMGVLAVALTGCGGSSSSSGDVAHGDTPTLTITSVNALAVAAEVYRVTAVDVPYTASVAMDPLDDTKINANACTDSAALSSGGSGGMMGSGMMDMIFTNCQLATTPLNSAHTLIVNGRCSNNANSATMETVVGDEITFTALGAIMRLHAFSVTRNNDEMTNALGTLHGIYGDAANSVMFNTPMDFAGSAMVPTAGQLVVTGANNTRLRLTVVNGGTDFTLDVDSNGDGTYESTQTLNWNNDFWSLIP